MKLIFFIFTLVLVFTFYTYGNDSNSSGIQIKFQVPKDWKMVDRTTYILQDLNKTLSYWEKELSSGSQPWRLEPVNVAAACLWDFGIQDGTDIFNFSEHLKIVVEGEIYSLKTTKQSFVVYIKTGKQTPIAYKLELKE
jgi:hypothetical protein